jgi:hypothetical protein
MSTNWGQVPTAQLEAMNFSLANIINVMYIW